MTQAYKKLIRAHASSDGDGVKIQRVALFNEALSDPFLMIDELRSDNPDDYIGGFPPHPHRGMETLTYLIQGGLEHRDHMGNRGMIHSGGAQWMSAGRGVIHSEMPSLEMDGLHGFQLWINLPAAEKMQDPAYRDVPASDIPQVQSQSGVSLKLIAGQWTIDGEQFSAPLSRMAADAGIADVQIAAGQSLTLPLKAGYQAMAFMYDGNLKGLNQGKALVVFNTEGDQIVLEAEQDCRLLLLSGRPLQEPVAHYGPFVMNTVEEIQQAIADYNAGRFGN
ncbi:pirin family protein [Oceanobacter mangrovi]|uniref:pirin family protein n=1 Tax=Oceanobacter mangrovi TaxID=2862510 RepID=UPI001C8E2608|nr:pirin family protein [Oceanobacter mangrovi]